MATYTHGDKVKWGWCNGVGIGTVEKIYTRKMTRSVKRAEVARNRSGDDPASYIERKDGDGMLKLSSEVRKG